MVRSSNRICKVDNGYGFLKKNKISCLKFPWWNLHYPLVNAIAKILKKKLAFYYRPPCLHRASIELFIKSFALCIYILLSIFSFVMDVGLRNFYEAPAQQRLWYYMSLANFEGIDSEVELLAHKANGKSLPRGGHFC